MQNQELNDSWTMWLIRYFGDEAAVETDDKRIVGECENISLSERLLDLIAQYQMLLE